LTGSDNISQWNILCYQYVYATDFITQAACRSNDRSFLYVCISVCMYVCPQQALWLTAEQVSTVLLQLSRCKILFHVCDCIEFCSGALP